MATGAFLPNHAPAQVLEGATLASLPAPRLVFSSDEMALAQAVATNPGLADFYGANGLRPVFLGQGGGVLRQALIRSVEQAPSHGLPPRRYAAAHLRALDASGATTLADEMAFAQVFQNWTHDIAGGILDPASLPGNKRQVIRPGTGDMLRGFVSAPDPGAYLDALAPQDPRYRILQQALARQGGGVAPPLGLRPVPSGSWREGDLGPQIALLRDRLAALGHDAGPAPQLQLFDAGLTRAVASFQAAAGLTADGIAGPRSIALMNGGPSAQSAAILVALERMRWMAGQDPMARQVWVNLPEFAAHVLDGGQEVFSTRVVIGKADPEFETPEFSETMKYVVANPRWNVPRSITVKEYLPKLKANRNAVSQLDILDRAGNVIPRDRIDFSRYTAANFPYRMRQKPSDDNALGQVKFLFPNPWNIYLHDTPSKHLFNQASRAYSHGCIRIGRPIDLAHELLQGQVGNPEAAFGRALASGDEAYLNLRHPVPVHLVYFTAFPDRDGKIRRYPDIYGRDAMVHAALVKAAEPSGLDFASLSD
ncbi:MAG: L,D-transpeptidase family protein [Paracoccus sp. (in: a-proteobacteria)]|uniref:L,D-transpeptidase family protein n=1 Tax=Paracoccus sp. TaxID=267 RepID=UPI0039E61763